MASIVPDRSRVRSRRLAAIVVLVAAGGALASCGDDAAVEAPTAAESTTSTTGLARSGPVEPSALPEVQDPQAFGLSDAALVDALGSVYDARSLRATLVEVVRVPLVTVDDRVVVSAFRFDADSDTGVVEARLAPDPAAVPALPDPSSAEPLAAMAGWPAAPTRDPDPAQLVFDVDQAITDIRGVVEVGDDIVWSVVVDAGFLAPRLDTSGAVAALGALDWEPGEDALDGAATLTVRPGTGLVALSLDLSDWWRSAIGEVRYVNDEIDVVEVTWDLALDLSGP